MKKKKNEHLGEKLKRFRLFRGLTQEQVGKAIGKSRALISTLETTGQINNYTLNDLAKALHTTPEEIESFPSPDAMIEEPQSAYKEIDHLKQIIEQQKAEIRNLNDTVKKQWQLIQDLTKSRKK